MIVPCLDEGERLARCVTSLLAQTAAREDYEVIIVDNGSRDASRDIARGLGVTVLEEPVRSSYAARNRGVAAARGEVLAFTDADCEVAPDWIEVALDALAEPGVDLVIGARRFAHDQGLLGLMALWEGARAASLTYGYTNNMIMRREVFDRFGPFDVIARGADTNLFLRVRAGRPEAVRYEPRLTVRHLEMTDVAAHLGRMLTYGRAVHGAREAGGLLAEAAGGHRLSPAAALRRLVLDLPEAVSRLVSEHDLGPARGTALYGLAVADHLAFTLGKVMGRLGPAR